MLGKLTTVEIEEVLKNEIIGRIGCHADHTTYIVPVSYAYDGKYIYVHSKDGMKLEIMRKNPDVCFEVENFTNMANWKSVIAWGVFEEMTKEEERKQALQNLLDRHAPLAPSETLKLNAEWPFTTNDLNSITGIVFRIHLQKKTGRFETHVQPNALSSSN